MHASSVLVCALALFFILCVGVAARSVNNGPSLSPVGATASTTAARARINATNVPAPSVNNKPSVSPVGAAASTTAARAIHNEPSPSPPQEAVSGSSTSIKWPPVFPAYDAYEKELKRLIESHPPFGEWLEHRRFGKPIKNYMTPGCRYDCRESDPKRTAIVKELNRSWTPADMYAGAPDGTGFWEYSLQELQERYIAETTMKVTAANARRERIKRFLHEHASDYKEAAKQAAEVRQGYEKAQAAYEEAVQEQARLVKLGILQQLQNGRSALTKPQPPTDKIQQRDRYNLGTGLLPWAAKIQEKESLEALLSS